MKKNILILTMALLTWGMAYGQKGPVQNRVEAQRVAFITEQLNLTPDESAKFWPLYNEFKAKQKKVRADARTDSFIMDVSDSEAEKIIADRLVSEAQILELKKVYFKRLMEAIPPRKLVRLPTVEMQFNKKVLEGLRNRRNGG